MFIYIYINLCTYELIFHEPLFWRGVVVHLNPLAIPSVRHFANTSLNQTALCHTCLNKNNKSEDVEYLRSFSEKSWKM